MTSLPSGDGRRRSLSVRMSAGLAMALSWLGPVAADAQQQQAGVAAAVRGRVEVAMTAGAVGREVKSGEAIFLDNAIKSGPDSGMQIMLLDQTTFTIGANSEITIDQFVFDPSTGTGKVAASVAEGVFRFVTGKVAQTNPNDMTIRLPTGNIGIRGTIAVGSVEPGAGGQPPKQEVVLLGPGKGREGAARIGVFVCQCGGEISETVNTDLVRDRAAAWPGVIHSQVLPFSCSPEAAATIKAQVEAMGLNRVVLAACSCCAIDQVCFSCTYQRVRCKDNLGIFGLDEGPATYEFVNIREQCAWAHPGDPAAATSKATALVAAAVARVRLASPGPMELPLAEKSALVLGSGAAARACQQALEEQGINVSRLDGPYAGGLEEGPVLEVQRRGGRFVVNHHSGTRQGVALVLAPVDGGEMERLLAACADGQEGLRPRIDARGGGVETHRPGIMVCDPLGEAAIVGPAAAARVAAWLASAAARPRPTAARVDPARCRACATCVAVCEFGAPQMVGQDPQRTSWIDPAICTGCGTCVAHCPSGAISGGYSTDAQLEAMLEQLMGGCGAAGERGGE